MFLHLIIIAWLFVALLTAIAEAVDTQGTVLGAVFTFLGWGIIPLSIVVYILATPMRRAKRRAAELAAEEQRPTPENPPHA